MQQHYLEHYANHCAIQYEDQYAGQYGGGYDGQYEWQQQEYAEHYGPRLQSVDWQNLAHPERGPQPVKNLYVSGGGRHFGSGQRDQGRGRGPPMRGGGGRAGRFGVRGVPEYGRDRPSPAAVVPKPIGFALDRPVCFKFAIGNNCPNGDKCDYKHERALAQQHIANMIQ